MSTQFEPANCARCGRVSPEPPGEVPVEWEALGDDGTQVICEGCLTGAEEQEIFEDYDELMETTALEDPSDPRADLEGKAQ
jgi:hypothetical protein